MDYPFTAHGFTSGNRGRLGVPEWNLLRRVKFNEGDEIWEVSNDGKEILRAIYSKEDEKFIIIKVHIKYEKRKNAAIKLSIKDLKGLWKAA